MAKRTYVEFEHDYELASRQFTVEEVRDRNIANIQVPHTAVAFKFFDVIGGTQQDDNTEVVLRSERLNVSPRHYYGGHVVKRNQVSHGDMLFDWMSESTGHPITHSIRTRHGGYRPFFPDKEIFVEDPNAPRETTPRYFDEHSKLGREQTKTCKPSLLSRVLGRS